MKRFASLILASALVFAATSATFASKKNGGSTHRSGGSHRSGGTHKKNKVFNGTSFRIAQTPANDGLQLGSIPGAPMPDPWDALA